MKLENDQMDDEAISHPLNREIIAYLFASRPAHREGWETQEMFEAFHALERTSPVEGKER